MKGAEAVLNFGALSLFAPRLDPNRVINIGLGGGGARRHSVSEPQSINVPPKTSGKAAKKSGKAQKAIHHSFIIYKLLVDVIQRRICIFMYF